MVNFSLKSLGVREVVLSPKVAYVDRGYVGVF
jgi:hypothetical protein